VAGLGLCEFVAGVNGFVVWRYVNDLCRGDFQEPERKLIMGKLSYALRIATLLLLSAAVAGVLTACSSKAFSDALIEGQLAAASKEQNKKLPIMVDEDTRWDSTTAGPGKNWEYFYTLVNPVSKNITEKQINDVMGDKIRASVCNMKEMEFFMKNEVTLKYKYRDSDGKYIGEVVVIANDCKKMESAAHRPG